MNKFLKNTAIVLLSLLFVVIIGFLAGKQEIEKKIIFEPSGVVKPLFAELQKKASMQTFTTTEGLKLSYINIKGDRNKSIILFCHGNDANITFAKIQKKFLFLAQNNYEVFALDYRGYGKSEGSPDEQGLYSDVSQFISYLDKNFSIKPENIIVWGHSLGSAVAIHTASGMNFKGIIAEGGFTSIEDMRTFRIKNEDKGNAVSNFIRDFVYNSLEISQKFASKEKISLVKSPMLILHSKQDTTTPYEMSVRLSELKPEAETFFPEDGGHNSTGWQDTIILEFIKNLQAKRKQVLEDYTAPKK